MMGGGRRLLIMTRPPRRRAVALVLGAILLLLLGHWRRRRRRRRAAALSAAEPCLMAELPQEIMTRILTGYPCDNLLEHLAICGQVCREWWRLLGSHPGYGRGVWKRGETMRQMSRALMLGGPRNLRQRLILPVIGGDEAGCALGALLLAMPVPLCYTELEMRGPTRSTDVYPELTVKGMRPIAQAMRCGLSADGVGGALWKLDVDNNRGLGSEGIAVLAAALPPTLAVLGIARTGCGDRGMIALSKALPSTCIEALDCGWNPQVRTAGWSALFETFDKLPQLRTLWLSDCGSGLGDAGALELASCLPHAAVLEELTVGACEIGDVGALALASVLPRCPQLRRLELCRSARRRRVSAMH
jgi:hypothetical protein